MALKWDGWFLYWSHWAIVTLSNSHSIPRRPRLSKYTILVIFVDLCKIKILQIQKFESFTE